LWINSGKPYRNTKRLYPLEWYAPAVYTVSQSLDINISIELENERI